jgi:hypothetical protein
VIPGFLPEVGLFGAHQGIEQMAHLDRLRKGLRIRQYSEESRQLRKIS